MPSCSARSTPSRPTCWCSPASCASSRRVSCRNYAGRLLNAPRCCPPSRACTRTGVRSGRLPGRRDGTSSPLTSTTGPSSRRLRGAGLPGDSGETLAARRWQREHDALSACRALVRRRPAARRRFGRAPRARRTATVARLMHPNALLELATELLHRVLQFKHPADGVVSTSSASTRRWAAASATRWPKPPTPGVAPAAVVPAPRAIGQGRDGAAPGAILGWQGNEGFLRAA